MDTRVEPPAQAALSHADIRSILIGTMLAMFLAALDQTIVATAMPTIGRELGDVVEDRSAESPFEVAATALLPDEINRLLAPLDEGAVATNTH